MFEHTRCRPNLVRVDTLIHSECNRCVTDAWLKIRAVSSRLVCGMRNMLLVQGMIFCWVFHAYNSIHFFNEIDFLTSSLNSLTHLFRVTQRASKKMKLSGKIERSKFTNRVSIKSIFCLINIEINANIVKRILSPHEQCI